LTRNAAIACAAFGKGRTNLEQKGGFSKVAKETELEGPNKGKRGEGEKKPLAIKEKRVHRPIRKR